MTSVTTTHDTGRGDPIAAADRYVAEIDREPVAAPDPRQLAVLMREQWRAPRATPGMSAVDARWVAMAELAIDYVRCWPTNVAEGGVSAVAPAAPGEAPAPGGSTADRVQVGDRDPSDYTYDAPDPCSQRDRGFLCTLEPDHAGQHVAGTGRVVAHVWPNEATR